MIKPKLWGYLSLLILTGCGGGSSSEGDNNPQPQNTAPTAEAGASVSVIGGTIVMLDASASSDSDGDALTYTWSLDSTTTAHFVDEDNNITPDATEKLLIPASEAGNDVVVRLEVDDGTATATDTVTYAVEGCPQAQGYILTECIDPNWLGPMA